MANPIKVLLLEDNSSDAELMLAQLSSHGFQSDCRRVESEAKFLSNLKPELDLILADYHLPQFDAIRALELLRERRLDIPFIIVSGVVKDEFIVEAIKHGASDFLLKDRMARLGTAVDQALEARRLHKLQEQTEKTLHEAQERYGLLARVCPVGIVHFDPSGQCIGANERWCAISGLDAKRAIGEGWAGTLHPDDRGQVLSAWCESVRRRLPFSLEYRFRHPGGIVLWAFNQAEPDIDEDGKLRGFVSIVTDITRQKTTEAALRASEETGRRTCEQLERTNAKYAELYKTAQRFVEDVSHEFRTPLTVVKGYTDALSDGHAGPITDEQKEYLGYVADRTRDLAQLVDDLLDSGKLRAGSLRIDRKRHRVADIIGHARAVITAKAAANRIEVREEIQSNLPEIYADAEKSERILVNFAVNAIKFSPPGGQITLWARAVPEGGTEIGVTDDGPGISLENQKLLFERFRQVGNSGEANIKGFGLGLSIARELVALNLGQIHVVSAPGQGSTFSFTLPPNDPKIVLQSFLNYLRQLPKPDGTIGLVRLAASDGAAGEFLAATLLSTDLLLEQPARESLLLVGYTDDLSIWVDRLKKEQAKFAAARKSSNGQTPAQIEILGAWPWPGSEQKAMDRITEELLQGEIAYA